MKEADEAHFAAKCQKWYATWYMQVPLCMGANLIVQKKSEFSNIFGGMV